LLTSFDLGLSFPDESTAVIVKKYVVPTWSPLAKKFTEPAGTVARAAPYTPGVVDL
jgi:hypothetical protein